METKEYLDALNQLTGKSVSWTDATTGRYGGTWAHPKLAIFFARWLDVRFAVWCDAMIEDILKYLVGDLRTRAKFFLQLRCSDMRITNFCTKNVCASLEMYDRAIPPVPPRLPQDRAEGGL